jgi:hypothetical protein
VFVAAFFFDKPQLHGSAIKMELGAKLAFHETLVAPVEELGVCTKDFEGRDWVVIFLYHVVQFGGAVFEAGGRVFGNNAAKPAVEHPGRNTGFSGVGNVEREVKYFGNILAGLSDTQRRAYIIADNKLALNGGWDDELLALELGELHAADFDMALLGFEADELAIKIGLGADFEPGTEDDQGKLDEKAPIICPACAHEFHK